MSKTDRDYTPKLTKEGLPEKFTWEPGDLKRVEDETAESVVHALDYSLSVDAMPDDAGLDMSLKVEVESQLDPTLAVDYKE